MDKGGGLGSMTKGLGGKISNLKDKTVSAGKKTVNKVSETKTKAKTLEAAVKGNLNLGEKSADTKTKFFEGIKKIKSFDDKISGKQAKSRIRDELLDGKSVVNKYGLFGPGTYKYLIYIILFLNICCIILLTFNKKIFYKYKGHTEVDVRLNKNVFYIYIFSLFLFILQLYTFKENYNDIVERRGKYQVYLEVFNVLCTLGLTYYIYKQIDVIRADCSEPNKYMCVINNNGPNDINECLDGPFQCGDKTYKDYPPPIVDTPYAPLIAKNFYLIPELPVATPVVATPVAATPAAPVSGGPEQSSDNMKKIITDIFNDLIKPDEERIQNLETKYDSLSPGEGIPGPVGPAGPPGTPGSDPRPEISSPSSNQFSNILCPNEPGGLCKDGETGCDDKGMCEGFALISLQEKIDLEMRYKDLNNNSYKVNNLMNNLETFLLNSLK
tara:strand:- start:210 stop:1529 length:1320 start_codon:yes stop_codon:yes gene_type:complete